jgi:hypothetical protein
MATFNQYTWDDLIYEVPLGQVYMLYSWATANDPINRFGGIHMVGGGYKGTEADLLLAELRKIVAKPI